MLIPQENEKDLAEIPKNIKQDLKIVPVRWIDDVLRVALLKMPEPADVTPPVPVEAEPAKGIVTGGTVTAH